MVDPEGKETELTTINKEPKSDDNSLPRPSIDPREEFPMLSWEGVSNSILKEGDQMSPLNLRKMRRTPAFLVVVFLFLSWTVSFAYQINQLYGICNKENGCVMCSVTLDPVEGADCQRLATSDLSINAGCLSVPMVNDYNLISNIVANTKSMVDQYYERDMLPDSLYTSLTRHGEITASMRGNSYNQMINPDVNALRQWFKKYFIGFNQALYESTDILPDSLVVAAGIKTIYSYITIGCAMFSVANFSSISIGSNIYRFSRHFQRTDLIFYYDPDGDEYGYLTVNVSTVTCPTGDVVLGASYDQAIAGTRRTNGLGAVNMSLPFEYVQMPSSPADINLNIASAEMLSLQDGQVSHCATSVFTTTPATLNSVFYECCIEKNDYEKLSEANAYAGLILTFAIVVSTVVFWPCNPAEESLLDAAKEVSGMFEMMLFVLTAVFLLCASLSLAQIPCDEAYGQHCPEASGFEVGECLKNVEPSQLSEECKNYI
eukprot:gene27849-33630_t